MKLNLFSTILALTSAGIFFTSCQSLNDSRGNRFGGDRTPAVVQPSILFNGSELFANDPVFEFQTTGVNPAPIRTLNAGDKVSIIKNDGRFTRVRLADGTVGYVSSSNVSRGSQLSTGGYGDTRVPDRNGNRFGGTVDSNNINTTGGTAPGYPVNGNGTNPSDTTPRDMVPPVDSSPDSLDTIDLDGI